MPVTFVRNLGRQPGVQLNPLVDPSSLMASTISDQTFGVVMRASRGRIDRAITVDRGSMQSLLGGGQSTRDNALNEAWAQLYEALTFSGGLAVVSRLVMEDQAAVKWIVLTDTDPATPGDPQVYGFAVQDNIADTDFLLQIKHLGCYNDGIRLHVWAEPVTVGGVDQETKVLSLRVSDAGGETLFYFMGSTDPAARDDYGRSYYLPDVVAARTEDIEILVSENAVIKTDAAFYGYEDNGFEKWVESDVLIAFIEGDTAYTADDYDAAVRRLMTSQGDFGYIASGGSQSPALLAKLAVMAFDTNRQLRFDIDGSLSVEATIAFIEALNMSSRQDAHLLQAFWMPVLCDDSSGVNPSGYLGASMLNIAMACRRNATKNAQGLAAKNYPVAGRLNPIARSGLRQVTKPSEWQLSSLAKARVNPVLFDTFSDGSWCVFRDQITQAPVDNSLRRLISVVDMSTTIDDRVVRYGKDLINSYPMTIALVRMRNFLAAYFAAAKTAGWLVPSEEMDGDSYRFTVLANEERPYDKMDVRYSLRYDGAVRQITVTQYMSR